MVCSHIGGRVTRPRTHYSNCFRSAVSYSKEIDRQDPIYKGITQFWNARLLDNVPATIAATKWRPIVA